MFEIVERAVILDVVANAIDEEVGGRPHAAENDGVPVAFALGAVHARRVGDDVADAGEATFVDFLDRQNRDALWDVDDWRRRFQRIDLIGIEILAFDDDVVVDDGCDRCAGSEVEGDGRSQDGG